MASLPESTFRLSSYLSRMEVLFCLYHCGTKRLREVPVPFGTFYFSNKYNVPVIKFADLFSFGSVLYQMTSGRPPFGASNTIAVLKRVCEDIPGPIPDAETAVPPTVLTEV